MLLSLIISFKHNPKKVLGPYNYLEALKHSNMESVISYHSANDSMRQRDPSLQLFVLKYDEVNSSEFFEERSF